MATHEKENLSCILCCNVFSDPAMLSCGHIFCRRCIETVLDVSKGNGSYTCPECRIPFKRRPVLYISRKLLELREQLTARKPKENPKYAFDNIVYNRRMCTNPKLQKKPTPVSEVCGIHHETQYQWSADFSVCMPCYLSRYSEDCEMHGLPEQENLKLQSILRDLEIKTRKIYLNTNTASKNIIVFERQKMVTYINIELTQCPSLERFTNPQVLTQTCFSTGFHFFEVEVESIGQWAVGLAYYSIPRTGEKSYIGYNEKSWSLEWDNEYLSVSHNSESLIIATDHLVRRVGIYLNYSGGQISFFEMADNTKHLYTFSATFTEPLHGAFYVFEQSWMRITS